MTAARMARVICAIGTTDLIFALDSIPAIFGLAKELAELSEEQEPQLDER